MTSSRAASPSNGVGGRLRTTPLLEAEFDRYVADLTVLPARAARLVPQPADRRRGPEPRITASLICERGLVLLEAEGVECFTIRRLAADLQISTRTLYKRMGSQGKLIRAMMDLHLSRLDLAVHALDTWESTAWMWCLGLHKALTAHPQLTRLMTESDVETFSGWVDDLAEIAVREGITPSIAQSCCRSVVIVTVNDAFRLVRAARVGQAERTTAADPLAGSTSNLFRTVQWIIAGARQQASAVCTDAVGFHEVL